MRSPSDRITQRTLVSASCAYAGDEIGDKIREWVNVSLSGR